MKSIPTLFCLLAISLTALSSSVFALAKSSGERGVIVSNVSSDMQTASEPGPARKPTSRSIPKPGNYPTTFDHAYQETGRIRIRNFGYENGQLAWGPKKVGCPLTFDEAGIAALSCQENSALAEKEKLELAKVRAKNACSFLGYKDVESFELTDIIPYSSVFGPCQAPLYPVIFISNGSDVTGVYEFMNGGHVGFFEIVCIR